MEEVFKDGVKIAEVMSDDEKFWNDVVNARKEDLSNLKKSEMYHTAILEMAEKKLEDLRNGC